MYCKEFLFKDFIIFLLALICMSFNVALAKCINEIKLKDTNIKITKNLSLIDYYQVEDFSAFQGLLFNKNSLFATGGYSSSNVLRLNQNGTIKGQFGKDGSELIASVASMNNKFAWTSHRQNKIIISDFDLKIIKEIDLKKSNLVGISFLDENHIIILNRLDPNGITVININDLKKTSFKLKTLNDLYDIEVHKECIYFSSRSLGTIYMFSTNDLKQKQKLKPLVFFKDLQTPQHMTIFGDNLYVLEAGTHMIIKINLITNIVSKYLMDVKRSCRGLAVSNNKFFTSCFIDNPRQDEKRTAIFEWVLKN